MKFVKASTDKNLRIPVSMFKLSGIVPGETVEIHTLQNSILILKPRMTAMELIGIVTQLDQLAQSLCDQLIRVCGSCDGCEGACPFSSDMEHIELPKNLLTAAGIPANAKLCAYTNPANGSITFLEAAYRYDLRDVPDAVLSQLTDGDICLGELQEHLMAEDIVYGDQ